MESPDHEPESPVTEDEDSCFPCKGCGHILEEGKAFELSGNRWHIDCFRCNKCDMLLDSDANLLLLGDGSLICNNCTYSCAACQNKIEDLAILTGDQAFCAGCFRCRNCKRKIENLKYARTSQGIFCMSCHETIMARRRKRNKPGKTPTLGSNAPSPMLSLDKSLPSLPVEDDSPSDGHVTPTELSPRPRPPNTRTTSSRSGHTPDQLSPLGFVPPDNHLRTPRSHKRYSQNSQASEHSLEHPVNNGSFDPYSSFIPVVLDPSPPAPAPLPSTTYRPNRSSSYNIYQDLQGRDQSTNARPSFERNPTESSVYLDTDKGRRPHISTQAGSRQYPGGGDGQDIGRKSHDLGRERGEKEYLSSEAYNPSSSYYSKDNESAKAPSQKSMTSQNAPENTQKRENFKLGEVPSERKKSVGTIRSLEDNHSQEISISFSPLDLDMSPTIAHPEIPPRGDSYKPPVTSPASVHKKSFESPVNSNSSSGRSQRSHGTSGSNASAITAAESPEALIPGPQEVSDPRPQSIKLNTKTTIPNISYQDTTSVISSIGQQPQPPFLSKPLSHPRPSTAHATTRSDNLHLMTNYDLSSSILPHPFKSPVSDLSMDEDIARVFGGGETSASILRRVSSAVRHGRSFSDLAARTGSSPKWPRSPSAGHPGYIPFGTDITSPILSLDAKEENVVLKFELRRSIQKVADLEAKLSHVGTAKALDSNITEKRNTVALLETEREAFLRELMVIKERVDAAKDGQPLSMEELKSDLIRGVTRELEDLKASLKSEIQALVAQRDQLVEEVNMFARSREQAIQDTEQLNLKNAQLADLNNELTRRIQGQFKANKTPVNGLGIYTGNPMELLDMKESEKRPPTATTSASISSISTPIPVQDYQQQPLQQQQQQLQQLQPSFTQHHANDGAEVLVAQKVTTLKNGAQPKKTFWKKGGASIMKGAGKGFNKVTSVAPDAPGAKIFGTRKGWAKGSKGSTNGMNGTGSTNSIGDNGILALFGTELEHRAEYEGNRIPNIVQKCIQEVEIRGMNLQGIYRKNGGASQMRQIQEAFERGEDPQFDSNVDICGVTSVLKQYFRNLPNPLLTYEIYERFIDTTTVNEEDKRVSMVKELIDELPSIHRDCLQFIIFHLARVAARKQENLMTTKNLAVVFAPTLLRYTTDEREISDMHAKNDAIQFLIDHNEVIF